MSEVESLCCLERPENRRISGGNCDRSPAKALAQNAKQPQFGPFHRNRGTIEADQLFNQLPPFELGAEPLSPLGQDWQSKPHGQSMEHEAGGVVIQNRAPRFRVRSELGLKERFGEENYMSYRPLSPRDLE
jgi:hypothetical protein